MGEIDHFTYGPVTPVLAYTLSVLGSLLGLVCTVQARGAPTAGRRTWYLLLAAWAIGGTGIWVMHFMAMLGFGVSGTEIRYDVPLTIASAIIAIIVVAAGLFLVGFGRIHPVKIITGGTVAGLGVAAMHYTGMAAMHLDGEVAYDERLRVLSVVIAVVAATAALWFTVTVRRPAALIGSALVMGVAVCGMHYVGMLAMSVHLHGAGDPQTGARVFSLILPILLLVLLAIVALISALLAAPSDDDLPVPAGSGGPPGPPPAPRPARRSTSLAEMSGRTADRPAAGASFAAVRRQRLPFQPPPPAPMPPTSPAPRPAPTQQPVPTQPVPEQRWLPEPPPQVPEGRRLPAAPPAPQPPAPQPPTPPPTP